MGECRTNFTKETNSLAYNLYQALLERGVSCKDLDGSYSVLNYSGIHCPATDDKTCEKGKGDGAIDAEEVFEYALNNYDKYQKLIEGIINRPLSWVLDDLDPSTTFDEDIRKKVQAAISEIKATLKKSGIKEGADEYNEKLAVALCWFVGMPEKERLKDVKTRFLDIIKVDLEENGLTEFWNYLMNNGGLRVSEDYLKEYSALDSLRLKMGKCTEKSKVLFAVLRMAGLKPIFISDDLANEKTERTGVKELVLTMPPGMLHVCVGIFINGQLRILDPMMLSSDANYKLYYPLSLRLFLGLEDSNRGGFTAKAGEHDKAITIFSEGLQIDPLSVSLYTGRGATWSRKQELDLAIADYSTALKIDPDNALTRINRSSAYAKKGELDKTIDDFAELFRRGKLGFEDVFELFSNFLRVSWQKDKTMAAMIKPFEDETERDIGKVGAYFILSYALWSSGNQEQARNKFKTATLALDKSPSVPTKEFFEKMLSLMPASMKKDNDTRKTLGSINSKLRNQR